MEMYQQNKTKQTRWKFDKADWDTFNKLCIDVMEKYSTEIDIDLCFEILN